MDARALTFAIADLHGRDDLLLLALAKIAAFSPVPGKVVFLGDYIDRGHASRQVIERLMAGPPPGWIWTCLKGNHEDIMLQTLRKPLHPDWWVGNGGGQTLLSYGHARKGDYTPEVVPDEHLDWLAARPLMHVDENRLFVHAGVDPLLPLDQQDPERLLWKLYDDRDVRGFADLHVVHGHHQFPDGPLLLEGRTDLDTFAWSTGRLVIGVFDDDKPGGPVELIEVQGDPWRVSA